VGRTVTTETIVLWACIAFIVIAGIAPMAVMVIDSVFQNGEISLDQYRQLINTARFWPLLGNSVRLALATTAVCAVLGVPAGVLFAKSDLPLRPVFLWILTVPFVLPPYFMALGWQRLIGHVGLFASSWLFGFYG
jgi:ABC-type Fe3+ transport system permease subunit